MDNAASETDLKCGLRELKQLISECEDGSALALASLLLSRLMDDSGALALLKRAIAAGMTHQYFFASCLLYKLQPELGWTTGIEWMERAAEVNNVSAIRTLIRINILRKDRTRAIMWFNRLIEIATIVPPLSFSRKQITLLIAQNRFLKHVLPPNFFT